MDNEQTPTPIVGGASGSPLFVVAHPWPPPVPMESGGETIPLVSIYWTVHRDSST